MAYGRPTNLWTAVVSGALAVVLVFTYLSLTRAADRREVAMQVAAVREPVKVVLAKRDIAKGRIISKGDLKWGAIPLAYLPNDVVQEKALVVGREALSDIYGGEQISPRRVAGAASQRASTVIRPGRVGLAVAVDEVSGVAGAVRPGDRVDILVTAEDSRRTNALYEEVEVLGVGGTYPFSQGEVLESDAYVTSPAGTTIVLELTPHQAQRVAEATEAGEVRLALRSSAGGGR
jgi:pilus assembly protein CpaB